MGFLVARKPIFYFKSKQIIKSNPLVCAARKFSICMAHNARDHPQGKYGAVPISCEKKHQRTTVRDKLRYHFHQHLRKEDADWQYEAGYHLL